MKTARMAVLHRRVQMRLVATGPPSVRARTVSAARLMGWVLAKACSQPGMLWIETKTELANTSGQMGRKPASWAVSGSATGARQSPGRTEGLADTLHLDHGATGPADQCVRDPP